MSSTLSGCADHRIPHALDVDEIAWLTREYGESAVLAAEAGADAIELHSNHDDVLHWFLSPLTNHRTTATEAAQKIGDWCAESSRPHGPLSIGRSRSGCGCASAR